METWDAIRARRNVRTYRPDPVPAADLDRIAEAGWRAPSASNRQHWNFIIVTDREQLEALATVWQGARHIAGAAAAIALVLPQPEDERMKVGDQDKAREILGVPADLDVAYMIGVGYPDDRPLKPVLKPNRLPFDQVVRHGHW